MTVVMNRRRFLKAYPITRFAESLSMVHRFALHFIPTFLLAIRESSKVENVFEDRYVPTLISRLTSVVSQDS